MGKICPWLHNIIVFVWSHYDGGNIDKEQWLRVPLKVNGDAESHQSPG